MTCTLNFYNLPAGQDSKSQITQAENNMKAIMDEYKQQTQASAVALSLPMLRKSTRVPLIIQAALICEIC